MKASKIIALLLALAMVFALAACGEKPAEPAPADPAPAPADPAPAPADPAPAPADPAAASYTIGINTWGSGVPVLDMFGDAKEYTLTTLGHEVNRMSDDFSADKELQNIKNLCAAGVDGIVFQAAAPTNVPQIAVECGNAQIPFAFDVFVGENADLEKIAGDEYYCGAIDLDMVADGAAIGKMAYENGCRKAVLIGGNIGDNNMDQRSQGFRESFEALGGEVLDEARCTDNSECLQKATDMLSANSDADCLYAFVGDYIEGSLTAIEDLALDVQVYVSCVDAGTAQYIKDGKVVGGNDGISLASYISSTLVINAINGNKIVDENGKAPRLSTSPFRVDQANVDNYVKVFFSDEGYAPFTKAMLDDLTAADVTYADYVELVETINLEMMLESNGIA